MKNRIDNLFSEYNKLQGTMEANQKVFNENVAVLENLLNSIPSEVEEIVNKYQPGILDVLRNKDLYKIEENDKLCESIDFVVNTFVEDLERMLL